MAELVPALGVRDGSGHKVRELGQACFCGSGQWLLALRDHGQNPPEAALDRDRRPDRGAPAHRARRLRCRPGGILVTFDSAGSARLEDQAGDRPLEGVTPADVDVAPFVAPTAERTDRTVALVPGQG